jgi:cytochrome c biogenesis protein CcdA
MAQASTSTKGLPAKGSKLALLASFVVPATLVVGFIFLLSSVRDGAEASVATLAGLLPVGYAFSAGMVSSVNPCGFFLLPSYASYYLGETDSDMASGHARLLNALWLGTVVTVAFVLVFASLGAAIVAGGRFLVGFFPYLGVGIGAALIVLGVWLLVTRRTLGISAASRLMVRPQRTTRNVFLFGIGYAACSLSCTLPVFLVVVGSALVSRGFLVGLSQFISYTLGMAAVLIAVTVGAAIFRGSVAQWLRGALPYVHRVSALFLVGAGGYLIYYWVYYADFFF